MAVHRIHLDELVSTGALTVRGEEAHHAARVRRLVVGERVELLDGRGGVGRGAVQEIAKDRGEWVVGVSVQSVERVAPVSPRLEVCTAVPKGSRLSDLIDGLAQVGAAVWQPLVTARGVRESWRREKLERVALEASKQSGRAWRMEIGEEVGLVQALRPADAGMRIVMADAQGGAYEPSANNVRLLVGPEGGWSEQEVAFAREAGATVCRFGVHVMRIETAAVVAAGVILEHGEA
jgi:16S rRNA (uracil1498-N3)-methyltransferase